MIKSDFVVGVVYVLCGGLLINGCVHSCKKHKDDPEWLQNSPLAIYRGIEYFWHNDFAGVHWDEKLKEDSYIMFQMMTTLSTSAKQETVREEVEKFRERVNTYPADKIKYLDAAANTFYKYVMVSHSEIRAYLDSVAAGNYQFESSGWNREFLIMEDSLVNFYGIKEVEGLAKSMDSAMVKVRIMASLGEPRLAEQTKIEAIKNVKEVVQWMKRIYQMIFNKPLVEMNHTESV